MLCKILYNYNYYIVIRCCAGKRLRLHDFAAATQPRASKIGFGKYIRLEEIGTIGGATGADPREK
jgi:hypothetical protein